MSHYFWWFWPPLLLSQTVKNLDPLKVCHTSEQKVNKKQISGRLPSNNYNYYYISNNNKRPRQYGSTLNTQTKRVHFDPLDSLLNILTAISIWMSVRHYWRDSWEIFRWKDRGGSRNLFWGGQTKVPNRKLRAKPESRARSARVSRAKPESRARSAGELRADP